MSFVYNNEVIDLLLKKSLGSAYTSSALVPGQENQILPKILNRQLLASPITNKTSSSFTWSASSNVAGGGTMKSLTNVAGETEPASFTYIKKYENIPMTVVAGTNYRAWKPSTADMISKLENTIIGKSSFPFTLTTNINNYNTIYNTNSSFKPVISNGVLLFLGNIAPDSSSTISFTEVHIYEGEFGAKNELELDELKNVSVPTPSNGEILTWDNANSQWIAGAAASSAIANANIEALNNVNVSHATTNQDDSLIYDKANSQWVAGTPVTTLAGLSDTTITTPSDKQSLVYNATNTKWENGNLTTENITDINLTSVANGEALVYDSGTSKFVNGLPTMNINNISDVNISTPAAQNALIYDTATQKWINGLPLLNVNDINDVNTSDLINGQVLVYDNNTQKWVPGSAAASSVTGVYLRDLQDVDMTNITQVVPDWTQSHKLAATTGEDNENLGKSVSTIGTWTAVGAPNKAGTFPKEKVGRVFLFKAGTQTQVIDSPTDQTNDYYGESLFLTATFLVVGSPGYDDTGSQVLNTGALLIYNYNSGTELYATTANQTLIGTANSYLGYSIDTNGTWMISGAPENITGTSNALKGKAYIYKLDGTWSQKKILTADDGANGDKFGTAVAINNDYAFVGCETKTSYTGGVYIYKRTSDTVWDALHIVRSKTLATSDYFGQSISVAGDFLMVGCPKGEYGGTADSTKAGEVFVYKKQSNGNWGDLSGNLITTLTQLGADIDGEAVDDKFGSAVAINSDGTILAIGAPENNNSRGHVRVYQYSNNAWTQLGSDIDGEAAGDNSGKSVSLNSDGTILAIGAPFNNNNSGHTRIFQYANNAWTQLGSDIDDGNVSQDGWSVSLNDDGSIVAIGAQYNSGNGTARGSVRVYQYANSAWTQLGSDIDGEADYDQFGYSVSLSSDGSIVATSSYKHNNRGHVKVYQYANNAWTQLGSAILGEAASDRFGWSISLSSNGSIVAIGAPYNDGNGNNTGHTRVFQYTNNAWTQLGSDIDAEPTTTDRSGYSVSLSSDGTIVAIGALYNDGTASNAGHVRVYQWNGTAWTQVGSDIDGEASGDESGYSVSLSSDGTIVAIGAPRNDGTGSNAGHVRVYQLPISDATAGYYENSILTATDTAVNDHFGCSVDITTQFGVIGARTQTGSLSKAGAAYMISNTNEGYWDHSKKITASDLAIGDEFGISVSISDRYASIGAWKEEDAGETDQGSAYLFSLGNPGSNDQYTLVYNSDTGRWSIGIGSGGGALEDLIGTQAMVNANTADGSILAWDATNQTWATAAATGSTGSPDQATPVSGPAWTTSWNGGDNQLTFNSHLIPESDDSFDIGSAANKIRDLYVSDNSLWVGDAHKISIEGGTMKFRKRDVSKVPASITAAGGHETGALASAGVANLSAMKLHHWETYAKTLNMASGVGNARISDVFADNDTDYADSDNISDKANTANPTFTGAVTLAQAPTGDLHAATKAYVDATAGSIDTSTLAPKASPSFTGNVGIGTTATEGMLHLKSTGDVVLRLEADTNNSGENDNPMIFMSQDGTIAQNNQYFKIGMNGDAGTAFTGALGNAAYLSSANYLQFAIAGEALMTMEYINKNVGIGTNSPDTKLQIYRSGTRSTTNLSLLKLTSYGTDDCDAYDWAPTSIDFEITNTVGDNCTTTARITALAAPTGGLSHGVAGGEKSSALTFSTEYDGTLEERMRINSSGRVGIGTTNPIYALDLNPTSSGTWSGVVRNSNDSVRIYLAHDTTCMSVDSTVQTSNTGAHTVFRGSTDGSTHGNRTIMSIMNSGNVGIGTTSPLSGLQVVHDQGLTVSATATTGTRTAVLRLGSPYQANHDAYCAKITSTNNQSSNYNSDLRFFTSSGNDAQSTEKMCILSNGNVGIGTTSFVDTRSILHIKKNAGISFQADTGQTDSRNWRIRQDDYGDWGSFQISVGSNNTDFSDSSSDAVMTMLKNRNVGIGTTSPSSKLQVNGSVKILQSDNVYHNSNSYNEGLVFGLQSTNASSYYMGYGGDGGHFTLGQYHANVSGNYFEFLRLGGSGVYLSPSADQKVGIGTTSPAEKLQVKGVTITEGLQIFSTEMNDNVDTRPAIATRSTTSGIKDYEIAAIANYHAATTDNYGADNGFLRIRAGGGTTAGVTSYIDLTGFANNVSDMNKNIVLGTSGTERMRIDANGKVGIGTNSPTQKLEVNGTVKATAFQGDGSALTGVAKQADIDTAINGLIDSAPGTLNTLNELAASIGDATNFAGTVSNFADVDTVTTAPTDGQALVWDNANSKWKPGSVAASGGGGATNVMGQSFFEILTQQPQKFQADGAYTSSTSELTINWKYDSILLFHDTTVVAKLCFGANAQAKSLPFISQIKIQLRSPDTSNTWTDYTTLTVSSSQDYNTTASLKTLTLPKWTGTPSGGIQTTLSKAGDTNKFDIRVYGINNAENYPNEATRALEYLQVFYLVPNPPSVPIWSSEVAIGSDASISFYYKCAETENIDPNNAGDQSDAFITSAITKYVEIQTLAYNNAVVGTEYTDTESVSNKNENETFLITLTGLRAGTLYKYKVQAKNNLADNYSDFSAFRNHTNYTRTPGNNGIGTSVSFSINNSSRTSIRGWVDGSSTVSGSQIYINTAASQKVTPATSSTQTIQITDPYSSTQHTTNTGYGNYVNGSTGLVTLKVTVDGTLKQTVSYGGFNTTPTDDSGTHTNFIDTIAQSDIYGTTNATKGFRLKGTFALNELSNTHITNTIGAARKTAHTLKYEYDRHADVGGSDASTTHNIYIDTLSGNPGITYTTSLVTVTSVKYTMGIASVDDMTINIVRTYTNCNSAHGFIRGDGKVGYIGAVSKTTYGAQSWIIAANNIDVTTPGSYTHSNSNTGINYTQAFTNGTNNSLTETSYAYSLIATGVTGTLQNLKRGSATANTTLSHFHDHNSYANDTTATSKLTLSNLYEITSATISKFNTDMGAIATQAYTSHSTVPQAYTLLYINGGFRTNANFTYPDTSNINYDSVSVNTYSHGTTAYSTTGTSDANGYKWYCQKFSMSADKSSHNVGGAITDYLNVVGIGGLSSTTMNKVKDADDLNAIGFVQQTVNSSSRIGNLGRAYKSTAVWYEQSGAVSWATQDTSAVKANYGAVYEESSTKWGPILDTVNGNNDIYIFIGLKNTVSLS